MRDIRRGLMVGLVAAACTLGLACGAAPDETEMPAAEAAPAAVPTPAAALPPTEETAPDALNASPRHGEWVDVALPGSDVPISTWVVYPERSDSAPVVLVIHEIYGLTDWIRGVADQFAAEGFIAVAPDLLSGMGPEGGGTASLGERDNVVATILTLEPDERTRRLNAVRTHALNIPAGNGRLGSVGFCWGGGSELRLRGRSAGPQRRSRVLRYVARRGFGLRAAPCPRARTVWWGRRAGELDHSDG